MVHLYLPTHCYYHFYRYLEVESREVDCTDECMCLDPVKAVDMVDENTIGVNQSHPSYQNKV